MKSTMKTLVAASALSLCVAAANAKPILLKTPIAFGSHLPALGTPITWVSKQLPLVSGGQLKMKIYEPGKLVAPLQILDAVSSGKCYRSSKPSHIHYCITFKTVQKPVIFCVIGALSIATEPHML